MIGRATLVCASVVFFPLAFGIKDSPSRCGYVQSITIKRSNGRIVRVAPWRVLQMHDQRASILSFGLSREASKEQTTFTVAKTTRFLLNNEEVHWMNVVAIPGAGFRPYPITVTANGNTASTVNNTI